MSRARKLMTLKTIKNDHKNGKNVLKNDLKKLQILVLY